VGLPGEKGCKSRRCLQAMCIGYILIVRRNGGLNKKFMHVREDKKEIRVFVLDRLSNEKTFFV